MSLQTQAWRRHNPTVGPALIKAYTEYKGCELCIFSPSLKSKLNKTIRSSGLQWYSPGSRVTHGVSHQKSEVRQKWRALTASKHKAWQVRSLLSKPLTAWYCPALHNCLAVTVRCQEAGNQDSLLFAQNNTEGAGKPLPRMSSLGRAPLLPAPWPGRGHQEGRASELTKGEGAASCRAVPSVLYLAGPPGFGFIHYLT